MMLQHNVPLAPYTSFGVGGAAELFMEVPNSDELLAILQTPIDKSITVLGYGSNVLISDAGIPGLVLRLNGGSTRIEGTKIIADAGCWWDDIVQIAISNNLWGCELLSEVPGSLGGALYINITAYGQSIGPLIEWVDAWNPKTMQIERLHAPDLLWSYKKSVFQTNPHYRNFVIIRACLNLSKTATTDITYQKALDIAEELHLNPTNLSARRTIIHHARERAGSLWHPDTQLIPRTAGSFFRNPSVSQKIAEKIMSYDESGKTMEQIRRMNLVHGGSETRVSAAHVMLASGFNRGQRWGSVKLNDANLLKIEADHGATAQDVYKVMCEIQQTCQQVLGVNLEPEVCLLGKF